VAISEKCQFFREIACRSLGMIHYLIERLLMRVSCECIGLRVDISSLCLERPLKNHDTDLAAFSDKQLLARFGRQRDDGSFGELIRRHGPLVMQVCRKTSLNEQDAEDAFQAVFLVLAKKAGNIGWQDSIANWLYGVAWRVAKNLKRVAIRRNARTVEHGGDMSEFSAPNDPPNAARDDLEQLLYPVLYELPAKYRAPIILCHLEGKSRSQAANELGITENVIKGRLERGRELLRKRLVNKSQGVMAAFGAGAFAQQVAHSSIPQETVHSLTQAAVGFANGAIATSTTSTSIVLAKGELLKMLVTLQLKVAALILTATCSVGACAFTASTLLNPTQAASNNQSDSPVDSLRAKWKQLSPAQRDQITQDNLKAIMGAVHKYVDDHKGMLPPAAVPNDSLPPEKRLSGFVLLLPYLNAKAIYDQIDLTKAWDDPANAKAAKSIVPEFLCPDESVVLDANGQAVSHFAFIRGSKQRDNGMFPLTGNTALAIPDINDGTSATLAMGQIHSDCGPWIAAGASTARFIDPPSENPKTPGFGSQYPGAAYFANGDGFIYFWDVGACRPALVHAIAGRADSILFDSDTAFSRFTTASEWLQAEKGGIK
jgi:RNA polymerase sigma factor (sigma-70 family)